MVDEKFDGLLNWNIVPNRMAQNLFRKSFFDRELWASEHLVADHFVGTIASIAIFVSIYLFIDICTKEQRTQIIDRIELAQFYAVPAKPVQQSLLDHENARLLRVQQPLAAGPTTDRPNQRPNQQLWWQPASRNQNQMLAGELPKKNVRVPATS